MSCCKCFFRVFCNFFKGDGNFSIPGPEPKRAISPCSSSRRFSSCLSPKSSLSSSKLERDSSCHNRCSFEYKMVADGTSSPDKHIDCVSIPSHLLPYLIFQALSAQNNPTDNISEQHDILLTLLLGCIHDGKAIVRHVLPGIPPFLIKDIEKAYEKENSPFIYPIAILEFCKGKKKTPGKKKQPRLPYDHLIPMITLGYIFKKEADYQLEDQWPWLAYSNSNNSQGKPLRVEIWQQEGSLGPFLSASYALEPYVADLSQ